MSELSDKAKLDSTLQEFLSQQGEDKRLGYTMANLHAQMHEFLRTVHGHTREIAGLKSREEEHIERVEQAHDRLDAHRNAIVGVKRHLRHLPATSTVRSESEFDKDELNTGNFDIAALTREVNEQRSKRLNSERVKAEEITWWKRNLISLVLGVVGVVATALFSILITLAIAGASSKQSQPASVNQK